MSATTAGTDLKIQISRLNARHMTNELGLAWWDLADAPRADRPWMRRDNDSTLDDLIGKRFYVIRRQRDHNAEGYTYLLSEGPGRTNMSHDTLLKGWLGTTDNINRRALGYFEVVGRSATHIHLREVAE